VSRKGAAIADPEQLPTKKLDVIESPRLSWRKWHPNTRNPQRDAGAAASSLATLPSSAGPHAQTILLILPESCRSWQATPSPVVTRAGISARPDEPCPPRRAGCHANAGCCSFQRHHPVYREAGDPCAPCARLFIAQQRLTQSTPTALVSTRRPPLRGLHLPGGGARALRRPTPVTS